MNESIPHEHRTINRWWFVVTAMIALILGTAALTVVYNVTALPMLTEHGWTLAEFTNGVAISVAGVGISALAVGPLVARYGPRRPTVPISIAFGATIMLVATTNENAGYWYFLGLMLGLLAGANLPIAHSTVVTAWFSDRRGLALGLLAMGPGVGGIILPPVAAAIEAAFGWRAVYLVIGLLFLLIPPAIYAFVTRLPVDAAVSSEGRPERAAGDARVRTAAGHRQFFLLLGGILFVSTALLGLTGQVFPIAIAQGYNAAEATLLLSTLAVSSLVVHLIVGLLLDRVYAPAIAFTLFALGAVGTVVLFSSTNLAISAVGVALIGAAFGAEADVIAYITSRYFPLPVYAKMVGLSFLMLSLGGAAGLFLYGQLVVASGGYTVPMVVLVCLVGLGAVCFLGFGRYRFALDGTLAHSRATGEVDSRIRTHAR